MAGCVVARANDTSMLVSRYDHAIFVADVLVAHHLHSDDSVGPVARSSTPRRTPSQRAPFWRTPSLWAPSIPGARPSVCPSIRRGVCSGFAPAFAGVARIFTAWCNFEIRACSAQIAMAAVVRCDSRSRRTASRLRTALPTGFPFLDPAGMAFGKSARVVTAATKAFVALVVDAANQGIWRPGGER